MGMAAPVYYTADMVRALPDDGNRYEEVVHATASRRLRRLAWLRAVPVP